eukprot:Gb_36645 [translate_table: standard]
MAMAATVDSLLNISTVNDSILSIAVVLCIIGAAIYIYERVPTWKVNNIPSPPSSWLLGHLPLLAKHVPDVFIRLARQYGPIYRFNIGRQPLVIIADADLCREVGIKKFKHLSNRSIPAPIASSPLHQKGLFFTRNPRWSSMRGAIQPLYQTGRITGWLPVMERAVCALCSKLATKDEIQDINVSDLFNKAATDIIGEAAFGVRFGLTEEDTSSNPVEVSDFIKQQFRQILRRIPGAADWKVEKNNQKLTKRLNEIVEKRSKDLRGESRNDFLSTLLNARESSKLSRDLFSPDYLSALTYAHLLAGSATTSFTLSTILYLVSAHADVEKKLLEEIDAFGPPDRNPTSEDLDKFPYLNQVIKEAMRFYTVSPLVAREASEAVEIGGYLLPKGTWVWMALNVLAKDSRYFPEPEKFKPERFDRECEEEKKRHPYANIPFGIGPRACTGMKFALQEIKVALIHLYQLFTFEHSPALERPLAFQFGILLDVKFGVRLRLRRRLPKN